MSDIITGLTSSLKNAATKISRNEHVRKITEAVNDQIMGYSETEMKIREATNEDPWGPTGPLMKEISEMTKRGSSEDFYTITSVLFNRMLVNNKDSWRRVYKSLVLLDYLLKNGSDSFVSEAKFKSYEIRRLESYKYIDDKGKDQGINIRHRAKLILDMLNDETALQNERDKASSDDKSKYRGYDKHDLRMNSSYSSSNYSNDYNGRSNYDYGSKSLDNESGKEVSSYSFENSSKKIDNESVKRNEAKDDDDDGFGDFVSCRTTSTAPTANTANATRIADDLFSPSPIIPPPPANSSISPGALPRRPSLGEPDSNIDLLGNLTTSSSTTNASSNVDLFSSIPAQPISLNSSNTLNSGNVDLFNCGISQSVNPTTPSNPANLTLNNDFSLMDHGFNLSSSSNHYGSDNNSQAASAPKKESNKEGPKKIGSTFQGLDDFMNLSLTSSNNAPKAKTLNEMRRGN